MKASFKFGFKNYPAKNQICYCPESRILYKKYFLPCGGHHDRQNPNWKPFQLFEQHYLESGYDFYEARDMVLEWIGHKLICECKLLNNAAKINGGVLGGVL
jgi:hypothetical protein